MTELTEYAKGIILRSAPAVLSNNNLSTDQNKGEQ
jgi:hypothetical protein